MAADSKLAISVKDVSKTFRLPHEKQSSLKGIIVNFWRRKKGYEKQQVLADVSFEIKKGEFFGIVGRNGSGKSTMLKLLAGIYTPDSGEIKVNGQLTPFIELGVGFNPELTGRENVFLNGALLGFSRKEMAAMYDEIVEFAELPRFMDQKLKNYSSGMQVRLAFSIAIRANTDILLVDEVLAVGDALFQQKCYDYFQKLKDSNRTVVFISHDMGAVQSFCDRAMLIDKGEIVLQGGTTEVTARYNELLANASENVRDFESKELTHIGVGGAEIMKADILDDKGKVVTKIPEGQPFGIRVHYKVEKPLKDVVFGVGIMGQEGQSILGPNSREVNLDAGTLKGRGHFDVAFPASPLSPNSYRVRAGLFNASVTIPYDFVENLTKLTIVGKRRYGDIFLDPKWSVHKD